MASEKGFFFSIETPIKMYHLKAKSEEERNEWVQALKQAGCKLQQLQKTAVGPPSETPSETSNNPPSNPVNPPPSSSSPLSIPSIKTDTDQTPNQTPPSTSPPQRELTRNASDHSLPKQTSYISPTSPKTLARTLSGTSVGSGDYQQIPVVQGGSKNASKIGANNLGASPPTVVSPNFTIPAKPTHNEYQEIPRPVGGKPNGSSFLSTPPSSPPRTPNEPSGSYQRIPSPQNNTIPVSNLPNPNSNGPIINTIIPMNIDLKKIPASENHYQQIPAPPSKP